MKYIYLHGFASGPLSVKARLLSDRFQELGRVLHVPDLNQGDFFHLTLSRQIQQIHTEYLVTSEPCTIIGSSFGGLTAAWLGQNCPNIKQLILLAPAFQFLPQWLTSLGIEQNQIWQQRGQMAVYHHGYRKMMPISYDFVIDLQRYDETRLTRSIPTLIIHGIQDDVIALKASQHFAHQRPYVTLVAVESDHTLGNQLERIWQEITSICGFCA